MPKHSIELDCPPFAGPRPGDLLPVVIAGTPLEGRPELTPEKPVSAVFGNWTWVFELEDETWATVQPILASRITALYNHGFIRYGSW
jgi:hypothetical protein